MTDGLLQPLSHVYTAPLYITCIRTRIVAVYIYTPKVQNIVSSIAQYSVIGIKIYLNVCESIWYIWCCHCIFIAGAHICPPYRARCPINIVYPSWYYAVVVGHGFTHREQHTRIKTLRVLLYILQHVKGFERPKQFTTTHYGNNNAILRLPSYHDSHEQSKAIKKQ